MGALWLCFGAMMCQAIIVMLPPTYLTTFGETFGGTEGLSNEQLGRIPAVIFASLVLTVLVTGPLADRWGTKLFAMLGLCLTSAGLGALAAAGSYEMLLAAACLMGLGAGMIEMVLNPMVCALQPQRRASAMNWLHSFYCIGALGTVLICSQALAWHIPWRTVTFVMILLPVAVLAGFAWLRVPPTVQHDRAHQPIGTLIKRPFLLVALGVILLAGATEHGMGQWLPAYAETAMGYTKVEGGRALVVFLAVMAAGRLIAASLERHIKPILLMIVCCIIVTGLYAVACFSASAAVALGACIAIGFVSSCLWPTTLGIAADRFPHGGATMLALMSAAGNAGCLIMPWVIGVVAVHSNLRWGMSTVIFAPVIMVALLAWMWKVKSQPDGAAALGESANVI